MRSIVLLLILSMFGCSPKTYTLVIQKCRIDSVYQVDRYEVSYMKDYVYHTECNTILYSTEYNSHQYNVGDSIPISIIKVNN